MHLSTENLWNVLAELRSRLPFLTSLEKDYPESEVYLVGGAVRDLILNRDTKDYDFLVRHVPAEALGKLLRRHGKVSWVGKQFGVFKFYPADERFEEAIDVALPRTEDSFSNGGGYRDFDITTDPTLTVTEDLSRRDFTINAMAAHLKKNVLIDPYSGFSDLEAACLRAVGEPAHRFSEDTSRVLRGLRFAAQLDLDFDDESWSALKQSFGPIHEKREDGSWLVPRETIAKEFIKAMVSHPVRAFDLWDESGAFANVIPELLTMKGCPQPPHYHSEGDVWRHTRLALSQLTSQAYQDEFKEDYDAETVLSVLFHDIAKPVTIQTPEKDGVDRIRFNNHDNVGAKMAKEIGRRLKLSSFQKTSRYYISEDHLTWLIEKHLILVHGDIDKMRAATIERIFLNPDRPGKKLMQLLYCDGMATVPQNNQEQLSYYRQIKKRIAKIEALSAERAKIPAPLLNGRDVMKILDISSGPSIGKYLNLIREEQLSGRLSTKETAIVFLKNHPL